MQELILYSTGCPRCKVLESKLNALGIPYRTETDINAMLDLGLMSAPALSVDGKVLNFMEAVQWLNRQ